MNRNTNENGFTQEESKFFGLGARWHNGSEYVRRGWYLPWESGIPLTDSDRKRQERSPFGIFLGASLTRAKRKFAEIHA